MAYEVPANMGNAFTPREKGEFEYEGDANIDTDLYRVFVKEPYSGTSQRGPWTSRKLKFEGKGDNNLVFEGGVFDRRVDGKPLHEKAPAWSGNVTCKINHELTVTKEVSIWEKPGKKGGIYLSMTIRDPRARTAPNTASADAAEPAF
jgi:hypothetical protein